MTQMWWRDACQSLDPAAMDQARARQQQLTKPAGSLGQLEGLEPPIQVGAIPANLGGDFREALVQALDVRGGHYETCPSHVAERKTLCDPTL